jgi:hypothetical protein
MVTYTLRHRVGDDLPGLLAGLKSARDFATSGKGVGKLYALAGVVGSVRALEVTFGENGWHPHLHELLFLEHDAGIGCLNMGLRARWERAVGRAGLRSVNEHGFDFTLADCDIAAYVAKFGHQRGWNVEHELTKQVTKKGRGKGWTPTELLSAYALDGNEPAGELWRIYALAMKGKRQLHWSKGFRARLGLGAEKSDEELAEETDRLGVLLASLNAWEWSVVLDADARAGLLAVGAGGNPADVQGFLADLESRLTVRQARRILHSLARRERSYTDLARSLEEAEASELGVTWLEWRLWRRGGVAAIAEPAEAVKGACVLDGSAGRGKGVKPCGEIDACLPLALL